MRNAYALLGLAFIIVFGGAYLVFKQAAEAPAPNFHTTNTSVTTEETMTMTLTSSAFLDGAFIPKEFTCDGDNVNPPLTITNAPIGTAVFVLVVDDPDIPLEVKAARGIEKFDHWAVYNIPGDTTEIPVASTLGTASRNGRGDSGYTGPCPPPQYEPTTHRYIFRLYALSAPLAFITAPTLDELEAAAQGTALASATLTGLYTRVTDSAE